MKTSNKLLIAFASSLILIPLLGMIYISRFEYKAVKPGEKAMENNHFKSASPDLASIAIAQPFSAVQIHDAKGYRLGVRLVEDKDFGIKVEGFLKDEISTTVDANGTLNIVFKEGTTSRTYTTIIIYAPKINKLNVSKTRYLSLNAKLDSLAIQVGKGTSIYLDADVEVNQLAVATDSSEITLNGTQVKQLALTISSTRVESRACSFATMSITSTGKSDVEISGNYEKKKSYQIGHLILNTNNENEIEIADVSITNCSGRVSDQTKLTMPAKNLRQLFGRQ